jgi:hypothetical protein
MFKTNDPPVRFSSNTLVGNWFEERIRLDALKHQEEFGKYPLDLKRTHTFYVGFDQMRMQAQLKAALTYNPGCQYLRNGMKLMLANQQTQAFLAIDSLDKRESLMAATCTKFKFPVRRNVFQIFKIQNENETRSSEDGIIRYGDKIKIISHPNLSNGSRLFLNSSLVTQESFSKISGHQEAFFSSQDNFSSQWEIEHMSLEVRFKNTKEPVPLNGQCLIKHCATGRLLGSDKIASNNAFGDEFEAYVETMCNRAKSQNLMKEYIGTKGAELVNKSFGPQNEWKFVPASNSIEDFDESGPDSSVKRLTILEDIQQRFVFNGIYSFINFKQMLKKLDTKHEGRLDWDDFKWSLKNIGVEVSSTEFSILMTGDDACARTRTFNYCPFVNYFYNFYTDKREDMIGVFHKTLIKKFPSPTFERLIKHFNYQNGNKIELNKFVASWGDKKPFDQVSEDELVTYFRDMSVSVDSEAAFLEILRCFFA